MEVKNLAKHFGGVKAVDGLSIQFQKGKITALIGPNGSGKSTLVDMLTGMTIPDKGSLLIGGVDNGRKINPRHNYKHGISRTFQDARLFEQMSVLDNVLVVLTRRNVAAALFEATTRRYQSRSKKILQRVGLWEKRTMYARDLSYGQRKLLGVARALAMDAETYFFDEPLSGLFPEMIAIVRNVLLELKEEHKTVVLIDHNITFIREIADILIVLDGGKVSAEGEPRTVLARSDVSDAYLGK